jgi:hypothetical protein
MMELFDVDKFALYRTWLVYVHEMAKNPRIDEVISKLKKSEAIDARTLDYFMAVGLNVFVDGVAKELSKRGLLKNES